MSISLNHQVIFIHNPKAAGTSICSALGMGSAHMPVARAMVLYKYCWGHFFKFSFVRDPFDRLVSCYEYALMERSYWHDNVDPKVGERFGAPHQDRHLLLDKSFEECCELLLTRRGEFMHPGWMRQTDFIPEPKQLNFIGRYENLMEDFTKAMEYAKCEVRLLPNENVTTRLRDRQQYATVFAKDAAFKLYKQDYETFEYSR